MFVNVNDICDGSVGMRFLLQLPEASQLRVLYRSSSSGLAWPKSIIEGSGLKPEPPGGQQEKCNKISVTNTEILHVEPRGNLLVHLPRKTINA